MSDAKRCDRNRGVRLAGLVAALLLAPPAVGGEVEALRQALQERQAQQEALTQRLEAAERRIARLARTIHDLEEEIRRLNARKAAVQADLKARREAQRQHLQRLAGALRALYIQGERGVLRLWLGQDDPAAIGRTQTYLRYLTRARLHHLEAARAEGERLAALQGELESTLARLEGRRARLQEERTRLLSAQQERRRTLAALERRNEADQARLARLQKERRRLQGLVEDLAQPPAASPRGKGGRWRRFGLIWPVHGKVSARFGSPRAGGGRLRWEGWVIQAGEGTPVRAVDAGVVRYAGWLRGYGNLLIIDHGRDRLSLYGFNQTLLKGVGERVAPGEIIALVGRSGGRERPALYFELRQGGRPLDPARWLAKR